MHIVLHLQEAGGHDCTRRCVRRRDIDGLSRLRLRLHWPASDRLVAAIEAQYKIITMLIVIYPSIPMGSPVGMRFIGRKAISLFPVRLNRELGPAVAVVSEVVGERAESRRSAASYCLRMSAAPDTHN